MKILFCIFLLVIAGSAFPQEKLYLLPEKTESRVSSFENPNGLRGKGGQTNKTAKGNAFEWIQSNETKTLLDIKGQGIIQRIWLTIDQNPVKLRSLRLQMFWDGESRPAVDVPMGDFFCYNLGIPARFESAFFSSAEGRSYNCYIPMPFKKGARVLLVNEGKEPVKLYYDLDFVYQQLPANTMYFHAYWTRQFTGQPGNDFEVLPRVNGKGRFLGMSVGVNTDSSYGKSWWGEGEVKMYLDGDIRYPTIAGTGAEDYIGSAWGLGVFTNLFQGCTIANDSTGQFNFYRWHVPDAIYFNKDIRVMLQQIGGWGKNEVRKLFEKGAKLKPISIDGAGKFVRLLEMENPPLITDEEFPDGWVNFYRVDDYSAVSYFYLDNPVHNLPALPMVNLRIQNLR